MIENAIWSAAGVKSGGTQTPPEPRRLKFAAFLKDLCFGIAGRTIESVALADHRRISQTRPK
ncbi:hypothetical protein ES705_06763 [subsurface metagenome]